ncbi:MAG: RelA/SpoT domain-containing protein [Planctomycetes bacterium]|nr:RelA/SpoT domain-containing protein [Planctomycetota bacterium]
MSPLSKTQLDKLGTRLKEGAWTAEDLRVLDAYRRSFAPACDVVMAILRDEFGLAPTARPAKSTTSIVDKLVRESVRLTQIQDIAGCRVVVEDILRQDRLTEELQVRLKDANVVDRRESPSHGYRALHVIARIEGFCIEVQLRTRLQHGWAELSEKMADLVDHRIKYGLGDERLQAGLMQWSTLVATYERLERKVQSPAMAKHTEVREELFAVKKTLSRDLSELIPYLVDRGGSNP